MTEGDNIKLLFVTDENTVVIKLGSNICLTCRDNDNRFFDTD